MLTGYCLEGVKEKLHTSLKKGVSYLLFFTFLACGIVPAATADVDAGLSWLSDQSQVDGSLATENDIATSVQATAEALRAFSIANVDPAEATAGYAFLSSESFHSTEYLSRKIIALVESGGDASSLLSELEGLQQLDGSFSELPGFDATVLDTAFAAEAFSVAGRMSSNQAKLAVNYLYNKQNPDGGWGQSALGSNSESSAYVTSLVLSAIAPYRTLYNLESNISAAQSYLLGLRDGESSWGETFVSAHVLIALVSSLNELDQVADSLSKLRDTQLSNGSWGGGVYTTALALRALQFADSPPSADALASIVGTVIDADTQMPLEGVSITLGGTDTQARSTGVDGGFSFINLSSGDYSIEISLADYATVTSNTRLSAGQVLDFGTIQMVKQAQATTGTIRGTITDKSTGSGLAGVTVTASGLADPVLTDSSGNFQIANVQPGSVNVQASKSGYSTASGSVNIVVGGIYIFSPALTPVTAPVTELRGTVTDGSTGQPLVNASVSVTGATTATAGTDAQGSYQISGLNPGNIAIEVSATGYDSVTASATVYENNILEFSPVLYPTDTTPPGVNTAGVKGVVVDSSSNQPLGNVTVTATFGSQSQTITTNSDGVFEFSGIVETQGVLQFSLNGYQESTVGLTLTPMVTQDVGQIRLKLEQVGGLHPDLIVESIDTSGATTDINILEFSGSVSAVITNQGAASAPQAVAVLAFYDNNKDGDYDAEVDILLGNAATLTELNVGANEAVQIPVLGVLPYRDAPIKVWVDSAQSVIESDEQNNIGFTVDACIVQPKIGSFEPVIKWAWSSSSILAEYDQVMSIPIVVPLEDTNSDGHIDEQDIPSIVFHTYKGVNFRADGVLRAISGADGHELWTVEDVEYRTNGVGSVAAGDIDNDGLVEIVVPRNGGGIIAFEHTGGFKWQSDVPANVIWGGASFADLDNDGMSEIVIGNTVLNADGSLRWQGSGFTGTVFNVTGPLSIVGDVDLDGSPEVIAGASMYSSTGQELWRNSSVGDGFSALGNFNTDPFAEIVVVSLGNVSLLDYQGNIIWGPVAIPGGGRGGPPTVADVDGDGEPEIGVAGANNYIVIETDGSIKWTSPTKDVSSNMTGSSVFDFDGNGSVEIVYADEQFLRVYQGNDGAVVFKTANTSGTTYELPVIVDVDKDNHADIVVCANQLLSGEGNTGIRVYQDINNSWVSTRSIWNQHSYHINNINDNGTVSQYEESSWLSHNTYRLNAFIGRDPRSGADLTSAQPYFFTRGDGTNQLTALIGNAGSVTTTAGTQISFYEGDPNAGGTLLGSVELPLLAGDSSQTVTLEDVQLTGGLQLYVVADSTNIVSECNETNNTAWVAAPDLLSDLIVASVDTGAIQFDEQTLELSGVVNAAIKNQGNASTSSGFGLYAFFDANHNNVYEEGVDQLLGQYEYPSALDSGSSIDVAIDVTGALPFRDAPITVWVDSGEVIVESNDLNNTGLSNSTCFIQPEIGTLQPTVKWAWHSSSSTAGPNSNMVLGPAMVGQLTDDNDDGLINLDDTPDVVFMSMSSTRVLNAVSGSTGQEIWSVAGDFAAYGSVALGDIDADGVVEIVVSNANRTRLLAYEHTGAFKWSMPHGPKFTGGDGVTRDGIAIADMDGDGTPEIITGRRVYSNEGVLLWQGSGDYGGTLSYGVNSLVADVNLDGKPEVVAGRTLYSRSGSTIWHAAANSDGFNAIGDFDDDDFAEIVLVSSGKVYLLEHTGSIKWGPVTIPGGGVGGAPTVADMDGDGLPEIGVAGASRYMVLEHDGTIKWTKTTIDASSHRTGSSVFDFEGDGKAEVVYADEQHLFIYDGTSGAILKQIPNLSGTTLEYPVIADIDNDGHAELLVGVSYGDSSSKGLFAYESVDDNWVATRNIWNQHTYHITNINDDGTIPAVEKPSWLSHNTYRLNTFVDRDPRAVADLTASRLRVIDNGSGQPVSLQVLIGNSGLAPSPANVKVSFYNGDPAGGGTLLGTTSMAQLGVYGYRDVQLGGITLPEGTTEIYAFVDSDEQVSECNEANNITSTTVPLSTLGEIAVATDASIYGPNQAVVLQSAITNTGALSGKFIAELRVEDIQGAVLASFSGIDTGALASGAAINHIEGWNTATYLAGPYVLRGILRTPDGDIIGEDKAFFYIQHPDNAGPAVTLRTTTDKPVYHTTDNVQIMDLVTNLSTNVLVQGATLHLEVAAPDATQLLATDIPLRDLTPQSLEDIYTPLALVDAAQGTYPVHAEVLDSQGAVLAQADTSFQVQDDMSKSIVGSVSAQYLELYRGDTQVCTDVITNTGTSDINALRIQQLAVNVDTLDEISATELTQDLASGADTTAVRSLDTSGYEPGGHACILQAEIDGEWKILDYAVFKVLEPPINIDSTFETGTRGRLLVLLDDNNCGCWKLPTHGGHLFCEANMHKHGCDHRDKKECSNQVGGWFDHKDPQWTKHCDQLCSSCGEKGSLSSDVWVQGNVVAKEAHQSGFSFEHKGKEDDEFGMYKLTGCDTKPGRHGGHGGHGPQCESDPYGPKEAPNLSEQRAYLESLLKADGWSYTIVTDAESFTRELRSGGYQIYALFNERVKLPEQVQKELREAVNRGEGLLVAGNHDERNGRLNEALGIQWRGHRNDATGILFEDSQLQLTGEENFTYADIVARITSQGADTVASFLSAEKPHRGGYGKGRSKGGCGGKQDKGDHDKNRAGSCNGKPDKCGQDKQHGGCDGKPDKCGQDKQHGGCNNKPDIAVTTHKYGQGRAMYAAFDLLAQATAAGDTSKLADLIRTSLQHVHSQTITPVSAGVVPVTIKLTNQGIATPGRVVITLPDDSAVIDPGAAIEGDDSKLIWTFDLAEGQELTLNFWLRLPETAGPVSIDALIQTGLDPDYLDYEALNLLITPEQRGDLAQVLAEIDVLNGESQRYWPVSITLQKAQSYLEKEHYCKALKYLIMATDKLIRIDHEKADEIRLQVDWVIWDTSRKLWTVILQAQSEQPETGKGCGAVNKHNKPGKECKR